MKTFLALALTLIVGIAIGIAGEFFIPQKYTVNLSYGCILDPDTNRVMLPGARMYDPAEDKAYPVYAPEATTIKNYEIMYDILVGNIMILDQNTCNAIMERTMQ